MATVTVTAHAAQGLPVMDRGTGLCDAYVWCRLDEWAERSDIVPRTRNPVWNKVFSIALPDLDTLHEDPLEVRVYDHDTFSLDDLIGTVFIDLNCMLQQGTRPQIDSWFPLIDPIEGLHGEILLTVRIKFHSTHNPFLPLIPSEEHAAALIRDGVNHHREHRKSATAPVGEADLRDGAAHAKTHGPQRSLTSEVEGVLFYSLSQLDPTQYRVVELYGVVEELLFKADPESSRAAYVNSTRRTLEARVLQLYKLSGNVRRQLTLKVLELGCNCVLGYRECFDLDDHNGIIVRALGTPCLVVRAPPLRRKAADLPARVAFERDRSGSASEHLGGSCQSSSPERPAPIHLDHTARSNNTSFRRDTESLHGTPKRSHSRRGTHDTMSVDKEKELMENDERPRADRGPNAAGGGGAHEPDWQMRLLRDTTKLSRSQVVLLTVAQLPSGTIKHIGGTVCARSVKLTSKRKSRAAVLQERDHWWTEVREEIRANARTLGCNCVVGYTEQVEMLDDVALLSVTGTAVVVEESWESLRRGPEDLYQGVRCRAEAGTLCHTLHIPAARHDAHAHGEPCRCCGRGTVPELLLLSCPLPPDVPWESSIALSTESQSPSAKHSPQLNAQREENEKGGVRSPPTSNIHPGNRPGFPGTAASKTNEGDSRTAHLRAPRAIEVRVVKTRPQVRTASERAQSVAQALPWLEYNLQRQLVFRLRLEGFNCAFDLAIKISLGDDAIVATALATGACVAGLPLPVPPRLEVLDEITNRDPQVHKLSRALHDLEEQLCAPFHGTPIVNPPPLRTTPAITPAAVAQHGKVPPALLLPEAGRSPKTAALKRGDAVSSSSSSEPVRPYERKKTAAGVVATPDGDKPMLLPASPKDTELGESMNKTRASGNTRTNGTGNDENGKARVRRGSATVVSATVDDPCASLESHDGGSVKSASRRDDVGSATGMSTAMVVREVMGRAANGAPMPPDGIGAASDSDSSVARKEFVVQVDDVDEAAALLGMFDGVPRTADGLITTSSCLPLHPHAATIARAFVVHRRYPVPDHTQLTAEYVAKCCGDARKMLLMKLAQHALAVRKPCVVLGFQSSTEFAHTGDLHVRLSGGVAMVHHDASCAKLERAYAVMLDKIATQDMPPPALPLTKENLAVHAAMLDHKKGQGAAHRPSLDPKAALDGSHSGLFDRRRSAEPSAQPTPANAAHPTAGHQQSPVHHPIAGHSAASVPHLPQHHAASHHLPTTVLRMALAPFTLPVEPLPVSPTSTSSGMHAGFSNGGFDWGRALLGSRQGSTAFGGNASFGATPPQLQVSPSGMFGLRTGSSGMFGPAPTTVAPVPSAAAIPDAAVVTLEAAQENGGDGTGLHNGPTARAASSVEVHLTPLPFVPGGVVTGYLGRISQHFLRESRHDGRLGTFWSNTLLDAESFVAALVRSLGGTALVDYSVTYHELYDSDKGYAFFTLAGQAVTTAPAAASNTAMVSDT